MKPTLRRTFLRDVSTGMLIAGAGSLVTDLGFSTALADESPETLSFGRLTPLVRLMQETPADKLQPQLVRMLQRSETNFADLIGAAALANAQSLGGEDYVGYHCEMALTPALEMSKEMPGQRQALPVLKVLYRNTSRLQQAGKHETLKPIKLTATPGTQLDGERLRDAVRQGDMNQAEQLFAQICQGSTDQAYNALQPTVQDLPMVHRVVLAHRSWELAKLLGPEHAHTLLRQSVRYCVNEENGMKKDHPYFNIRSLVPQALDRYRLLALGPGKRQPEDQWIESLADTIYGSSRDEAVDVTAAALAEGMDPDAVAEALVLAANRLILAQDHDHGRGKLAHGSTDGVHSSDAMNAWRHMARVCDHDNAVVSLMVGAYFVAHDGPYNQGPYPHAEHLAQITAKDATGLLDELDDAVRNNDQGRASAAAQRYGDGGYPAQPIFERLLRFTVSEDGRLHGEKYYRTASEEFARARPAFRWRHVVSLARVTASSYGLDSEDRPGYRAPGYEEACQLLGVTA